MITQTYPNLEIIISDNASSDLEVENIARDFVSKDKRVSFFRQELNRGPAFNFKFVLEQAQGKYFMWAADDDEWDMCFVSRCVEVLNDNPKVILCSTAAILMDQNHQELETYYEDINTVGMPRLARARKILKNLARNTSFYGVYRISDLRTAQIPQWYGGDHMFMTEMSLRGDFVFLPTPLFYSMVGGNGTSAQSVADASGIRSAFLINFPNLSLYFRFLMESARWKKISFLEHVQLLMFITERFLTPPYPERISSDIKHFLQGASSSLKYLIWKFTKRAVKRVLTALRIK
jgi:glycosyltransferase involved in cell wall biosynthesis